MINYSQQQQRSHLQQFHLECQLVQNKLNAVEQHIEARRSALEQIETRLLSGGNSTELLNKADTLKEEKNKLILQKNELNQKMNSLKQNVNSLYQTLQKTQSGTSQTMYIQPNQEHNRLQKQYNNQGKERNKAQQMLRMQIQQNPGNQFSKNTTTEDFNQIKSPQMKGTKSFTNAKGNERTQLQQLQLQQMLLQQQRMPLSTSNKIIPELFQSPQKKLVDMKLSEGATIDSKSSEASTLSNIQLTQSQYLKPLSYSQTRNPLEIPNSFYHKNSPQEEVENSLDLKEIKSDKTEYQTFLKENELNSSMSQNSTQLINPNFKLNGPNPVYVVMKSKIEPNKSNNNIVSKETRNPIETLSLPFIPEKTIQNTDVVANEQYQRPNLQKSFQSSNSDFITPKNELIDKKKLADLLFLIDPRGKLEESVEQLLIEFSNEFVDDLLSFSVEMAKIRNSSILEAKDIQLYLKQKWKMEIPGYSYNNIVQNQHETENEKESEELLSKNVKHNSKDNSL